MDVRTHCSKPLSFVMVLVALFIAVSTAYAATQTTANRSATSSVSAGTSYRLVNRNSSLVIEGVSNSVTAVDQNKDATTTNQQWKFVAAGNYYKIVNNGSSKLLTILNGSTADKANVIQNTDDGSTSVQWQLVVAGNYYKIVNHKSGKLLEVTGSAQANKAGIDQSSDTGATNQQWLFVKVGDPIFPPGITALSLPVTTTMRDSYIMVGPDKMYYLTGTQGSAWQDGTGIQLWRSPDLKTWTALGYIWTFTQAEQDGCWCAQHFTYSGSHGTYPLRVIWAPELHYINNTYFIPFSMPGGGTGILRSTSGKITGPYTSVGSKYIAKGHIDPTLFQDDNGSVYYIDKGHIALMKSDMSGLAEALRSTGVTEEGVEMIKHNGIYNLASADFTGLGYYNSEVQQATNIYGPYTGAYEAVPWAGHGNYFVDLQGRLWCTMFGDNTTAPVYNLPAIVPAKFGPDNLIRVDLNPRS